VGIFFEDINMGADGGIYAELVKNRSFEFYKPLTGWTVQPADISYVPFQKQFGEGTVMIVNRQEKNTANPRFIRITATMFQKEASVSPMKASMEWGFEKMCRTIFQ
jgi:hypothetical protein